jgi:aspartyl-tRNA(Asn)/glutamyl-tRNA(Gln) amidotransferase subunit B
MPELPAAMRALRQRIRAAGIRLAGADRIESDGHLLRGRGGRSGKENAKAAANWLMGDVSSTLNREGVDIADAPVKPAQLALMLKRIADGTINNKTAKNCSATCGQPSRTTTIWSMR